MLLCTFSYTWLHKSCKFSTLLNLDLPQLGTQLTLDIVSTHLLLLLIIIFMELICAEVAIFQLLHLFFASCLPATCTFCRFFVYPVLSAWLAILYTNLKRDMYIKAFVKYEVQNMSFYHCYQWTHSFKK